MELQTEIKSSPTRPPAASKAHGEVRPEWTPKVAKPARSGSPLVEVPPLRPVAVPTPVEATAVPADPPPRPAPAPDQIVQAIKDLISLLPGKPAAIGLENGLIGIVMCLYFLLATALSTIAVCTSGPPSRRTRQRNQCLRLVNLSTILSCLTKKLTIE
jgi:hypothetical protein